MRFLFVIFFAFVLLGCTDKQSETKTDAVVGEVAMKENLHKTEGDYSNKKIVSMNFEELEKNYFQNKNDSIYIINFWATWCKPCVKELPAFEKIASDYLDKKVKVLLVSLDFIDKMDSQVVPFLKKNDIQSEVVLLDDADANSWIPKVSPQWTGAIPATIIYKKDNRKFYEQSFTFEELETELKTFFIKINL
ncbi:MAG: TlpA disulfide reductase family protein [Aequorivita sp.]|nr:TlpA disulfide reductase family protein [Aequorivita sp.]